MMMVPIEYAQATLRAEIAHLSSERDHLRRELLITLGWFEALSDRRSWNNSTGESAEDMRDRLRIALGMGATYGA
jgi:hypothetical protein